MQDALITVAWARYELAKAKLVKKNNVRGASDVDLTDFEEQVTRLHRGGARREGQARRGGEGARGGEEAVERKA